MMRNHKQQISEVNLTAPDQINNVRALEDKREYFDELPIDLVEDVDQVYGKVSLRVQALVFDNSRTILQGVIPDHQTSRSTEVPFHLGRTRKVVLLHLKIQIQIQTRLHLL
ncbi:hypothetical protein F2Q69_00047083 [Brassica cretica]|uniref:Uncharacterized protein n=1 Tax=Brassica cretica TaxID=69181 RepID=A0A8S9PXH6_BRACR|nr:hypothetical protein F2Q69_00047083 [Brassica cretica]